MGGEEEREMAGEREAMKWIGRALLASSVCLTIAAKKERPTRRTCSRAWRDCRALEVWRVVSGVDGRVDGRAEEVREEEEEEEEEEDREEEEGRGAGG